MSLRLCGASPQRATLPRRRPPRSRATRRWHSDLRRSPRGDSRRVPPKASGEARRAPSFAPREGDSRRAPRSGGHADSRRGQDRQACRAPAHRRQAPRRAEVILIDTTPLVALCDPRDGLHATALADLDRVAKRRPVVLCEPVLTEACFLLSHPVQRARLERLIDAIGMAPLAVEDQVGLRREVFAWLARYAERE